MTWTRCDLLIAAALPELISALDDSAADIRRRAAEALGLVAQGQTAEVTSRLASRLAHMLAVGDETQEVKREAALSIARLATDGEGVVDALTGTSYSALHFVPPFMLPNTSNVELC